MSGAAVPAAAIEAAVIAHGRASNPKWDHPIFGYQTFNEDQKEYLRRQARIYLEAAAPYMQTGALAEVVSLVDSAVNIHRRLMLRDELMAVIRKRP